ncbi:hypothetical protein [uncultured Ferrimonas sp.]|uniref:hypothetical protein n=1 Tax=uncultured Ferrimonas sp. TaxID=432640 RepID=UPI00262A8938|nr:hypothetical protein [uncultured Ferrimonas sp.]
MQKIRMFSWRGAVPMLTLALSLLFSSSAAAWFYQPRGLSLDLAWHVWFADKMIVRGRVNSSKVGNTVELWDAELDLLLATTTARNGRYRFKLTQPQQSTLPCKVEVRAGNKKRIKRVRWASQQCGHRRATIAGQVTVQPSPDATISVHLNGQRFSTRTDAAGAYQLPILSKDLEPLVLIQADAINPENGDQITLVNMAGSFARVLDTPQHNVTHVSSASYQLQLQANGGLVPQSQAELDALETTMDAEQVLQLAGVIKLLLTDDRFSLPLGQTNLLDFIADRDAVTAFIAAVAAEDVMALNAAVSAITTDSTQISGFNANRLPSELLAVRVANKGYLARYAEVVELNAAEQSGLLLGLGYNGNPINQGFDYRIEQGQLAFDLRESVQTETVTYDIAELTDDVALLDAYYAAGGAPDGIRYRISEIQRNYNRVYNGNKVDVVRVESRQRINVPDFTLADGSQLAVPDRVEVSVSSQLLQSATATATSGFSTRCDGSSVCVLGRWGGLYHHDVGINVYSRAAYNNTAFGEVIELAADGSAVGVISAQLSSWQVDDRGRLQLHYADGTVQTSTIIDQQGLEYGVLSEFQQGQQRYASYNIWVRGDSSFALDLSYLLNPQPQQYWNGEVNAWRPGVYDEQGNRHASNYFGWKFDSGMNVSNRRYRSYDYDGDGNNDDVWLINETLGWESLADRVLINRSSYARRYWIPLAATELDGERVFYVMEVAERNAELQYGGEPGWHTYFSPRVNIEREIDQYQPFDAEVIVPAS